MPWLKTLLIRLIRFLTYDIWHIRLSDLSRAKGFGLRQLKTLLIAGQGYREDHCGLRASALTFYTALSAVPVLALVLAIARSFELDEMLRQEVINRLPNYEAVLSQIFLFAYRLLENTKGNLVAGVGVLILLWTVPRVLGNIEKSFNDIWEVPTGRNLFRRLSEYLAMLLFGSLCLILAGGLTLFSSTQLPDILRQYGVWRFASPVVTGFVRLLPYILMWLLFTMLNLVAPNTKVRLPAALVGGVVAGTAYQVMQWLYLQAQVSVANYDAVYGSVAALPLFVTWIQTSWMIVLFSAELSYAFQHASGFYPKAIERSISIHHRRMLTLLTATTIVKAMASSQRPPSESAIAHRTGIPLGLVRKLLDDLAAAGVLVLSAEGEVDDRLFYPARNIEELTLRRVISDLDSVGSTVVPVVESASWDGILGATKEFEQQLAAGPANRLLREI